MSLLAARRWRSLAGGALGVGGVLLGLGLLDWHFGRGLVLWKRCPSELGSRELLSSPSWP